MAPRSRSSAPSGYSAAVVVLIAVLAAVTLLPALLSIIGMHIESLRVPFVRAPARPPAAWLGALGSRRRPAPVAGDLLAVAILVVLAIPVLNLELGQQDNGQLPKSTTTRQAYDLLARGSGRCQRALLIAVDFDGSPAHPDNKKLNQLEATATAAAAGGRAGDEAARGRGRAARRGAIGGGAAGGLTAADQEGEAGLPAGGIPEDHRRATRGWSSSRTRSARRRASRTSRRRRLDKSGTRRCSP